VREPPLACAASHADCRGERFVCRIDKLLHAGREKLSYLKIVTPRRPSGQAGKTSFILDKDGTFHEGSAGVAGRTLRAGLDSDDLARHRHLLERQHFMHRR